MTIASLFFQRYDVLYNFWLAGVWEITPADLLRQRPHPRVNSLVWNLWHLLRVEDAGVNRFVTDGVQVLDESPWMQRLNLPWRHHGSEMSLAEVDDLSQRVDIGALYDYAQAVQARTRAVVNQLPDAAYDEIVPEARLRRILWDEGLAHAQPEALLATYRGWTAGKCLFNFGLTHPYQHVGEIGVIAALLDIPFE